LAYGPSLKEIWDERMKAVGSVITPTLAELELLPGARLPSGASAIAVPSLAGQELLCAETNALIHASLSGVVMPAFDLGHYKEVDNAVFRRAARIGTFAPIFRNSAVLPEDKQAIANEAARERKRWSHFLITYADEARARGYPMLHPLLHQFPRDPLAGEHID